MFEKQAGRIRKLRADETEVLKDFLYEAIFIPEGVEPPDRSIIEQPELALYYEDFGKGPADNCLAAEADGRVVGAVWTRIMNDYGHVNDDTPSFAIALYREYRGKGIGTELMRAEMGSATNFWMWRKVKRPGERTVSFWLLACIPGMVLHRGSM